MDHRRSMKQSKVHVKFNNNTLFIGLFGHVKASIIDLILNELKLSNKKLDFASENLGSALE